ncbi:hypothetical protein ACFYUH_11115 [Streptomyces fimicarius]|uniref:hypothetical protein n=1 Tax=Streptomyces griseus TaxID=1911 RepID=UPI00369EEF6C
MSSIASACRSPASRAASACLIPALRPNQPVTAPPAMAAAAVISAITHSLMNGIVPSGRCRAPPALVDWDGDHVGSVVAVPERYDHRMPSRTREPRLMWENFPFSDPYHGRIK